MATYLIGDIQGCLSHLKALLVKINYKPDRDRLGFVGDLINRGPDSEETLEFISSLDDPYIVLGNHDLYFMAMATTPLTYDGHHTLHGLLASPNKNKWVDWLREKPLVLALPEHRVVMAHAGIPPQWSIEDALGFSDELSAMLKADEMPGFLQYFENMIGDEPACWQNTLAGANRLRYITNAFTRMRFCTQRGGLEFLTKSAKTTDRHGFKPWFEWPRQMDGYRIAFGHWASLQGDCAAQDIYALDTGSVWGGPLTAWCIEEDRLISVRTT